MSDKRYFAALQESLRWLRQYQSDLSAFDTSGRAFADQQEAAILAEIARASTGDAGGEVVRLHRAGG